ncbi:MAG: hypothetical protein FJX45_18075 [Alphaproteobacteria bacterium]|nr:hypothetical protein [Alphaproteobacteria bacterium]MBM3653819.1 hypothetical protein [Alphaproteobacteria bacterium]
MDKNFTTTGDVIDALGGSDEVSRITGRGNNSVSNWRVTGKFPTSSYFLFKNALAAIGATADDALWGFDKQPKSFKRRKDDAEPPPENSPSPFPEAAQ